MRCERCGEDNPARARFCLNCGAPLGVAVEAEQERKLVSVLFVDLVGFTGRSDGADPEDVRDTLQAYHAAARREIESFGGTLEKFIGDAVMAVFGAPKAHGDDAERAVRAGLRVLEVVAGMGLEARAAVNTGEAVVSLAADAGSGQALAMGDVVNTASRLQSAAPTGGLVVGEETHRLTREAFTVEPAPDVAAKGKSDPLRIWLVRGPAGATSPARQAPMLGRERELSLLESAWARAAGDRRPHLATVLGPPGIGKSRLQQEFAAGVAERGAAVLRGRCLPYGERAAYGAFARMVRDAAHISESDSPAAGRAKLRELVTGVLPEAEVEETATHLGILIGLGEADAAPLKDLLFYAARRLLEGLAAERPLLLVAEDIHWAERGQLDLFEYLGRHLRDAEIMVLALARPELLDVREGWGSGLPAHTVITLEPLSAEESAALAAQLLGRDAGARETVARLAEAAEGNPLFVEELTASLLDGRPGDELPTSVRAAIAARVDALPGPARTVLLHASVVGRSFWRGSLVTPADEVGLDSALATLEERDFIRRVPSSRLRGDPEYVFKHALIREVAYATLPRALRRQGHAAAARHIESAVADPGDLAPLLAHHWREAGEPDRAIEYLLTAAQRAERGWALAEALAHYDAALALAGDGVRKMQIQLARAIAQSTLDDHEAAFGALGELLPDLSGKDRLEALIAWTWAAQWTEHADEMMAGSEEALQLARELGDAELEGVATAHVSQALSMRGGPGDLERAIEVGRRALDVWVPGTRGWNRAQHYHMFGEQLSWTGHLEELEGLMTQALREGGDPQSVWARLRSASLRALTICARGRYEEGLALFEQTVALARELGRPVRVIQNYSTAPLRDLFATAEARRRSQECIEAGVGAAGYAMPLAMSQTDLVQTALLDGDLATAENQWQALWKSPEDLPHDWTRWLVRGRLAWLRADLALQAGRAEEAEEWSRTALELAQSSSRLKYQSLSRLSLGRSLQRQGRVAEAVTELGHAAALADRLGAPAQRWPAHAALGRALYAAGDDAGAEKSLNTAAAIIREVAGGLSPERAERFTSADPVREVLHAGAGSGTVLRPE